MDSDSLIAESSACVDDFSIRVAYLWAGYSDFFGFEMIKIFLILSFLGLSGCGSSGSKPVQDFSTCWLKDVPKWDINGDGIVNFADYALFTMPKARAPSVEICGIKVKDIQVISVNSQRTPTEQKLFQVYKKARSQKQVKVVALLNGKLRTLEKK